MRIAKLQTHTPDPAADAILCGADQTNPDQVLGQELAGEVEAVIDRRYPLEEVAEAHRHVGTGRKRGSVVIPVVSNP